MSSCKSTYDTPAFTASSMCCAWWRTNRPSHSKPEHALQPPRHRGRHVYALPSILDTDVTEPTTTPTLPLPKCVVDVHNSITVQTQITTSSTQLETRAPPSHSDDCDGQLDTLSFSAQEQCCGCGGGFRCFATQSKSPRQRLTVSTPVP